MVARSFQFTLFLALVGYNVAAFVPSSAKVRNQFLQQQTSLMATRRTFVEKIVGSTIAVALPVEKALASGGATAGGAYLLSAKQRYDDRVKQGVKGFLSIGPKLEAQDIDAVRAFFTSEDAGMWKDFSSAGYLLSNAFRTNSSAAPDSLPSVKKWKAFAANVEAMTKSLKKKDTKGALAAYEAATAALDEYLAKVELPPAKDISSS